MANDAEACGAGSLATQFGWQIDLGELPIRIVIAFVVAWIVAGLLGMAAGGADLEWAQTAPEMQSLGAAAANPPAWP